MTADATLPGMAPPAVKVIQRVEEDRYQVALDVTAAYPWVELARMIRTDAHLSWCFSVLARNTHSEAHRDFALAELRKHLTGKLWVTLDPGQAEDLPGQIESALEPPGPCAGEQCGNYGVIREGDRDVCLAHVTPDEYDEFERTRDH